MDIASITSTKLKITNIDNNNIEQDSKTLV